MSRFEQQFFEYFNMFKRDILMQPLMLGGAWGSGGGVGGRPGGFVGYLPQTRVSYDLSEDANLDIIGSGSLLDNLNHIRYRIQQLETASGGGTPLSIYENGSLIETNVTIIDFAGDLDVTNPTNGRVLVTISGTTSSGGGHTIQDEGIPLTQRDNLNFVGSGVTVTDDSDNNATVITIVTSSGTSGSTDIIMVQVFS